VRIRGMLAGCAVMNKVDEQRKVWEWHGRRAAEVGEGNEMLRKGVCAKI
jgi:hypothetical protein